MTTFNPFSSHDKQHFPEFSPMFKKKTPNSTERNTFKWSIDHIARLKPVQIDTDDSALGLTNKHSPDDDVDRQKAIDNYFAQTVLPSPWSSASSSSTKKICPVKKVKFLPLPSITPFIQEESLVESQIRDGNTADVGTQTTLSFPIGFDLEKLVLAALHDACDKGEEEEEEEGEEERNRDFGNSSLRRKLFGQPDRQSLSCTSGSEEGLTPPLSSPSPYVPPNPPHHHTHPSLKPLPRSETPSHHLHSILKSPAIILTQPLSPNKDVSFPPSCAALDVRNCPPMQSSMILHTPGQHLSVFSPIKGGVVSDMDVDTAEEEEKVLEPHQSSNTGGTMSLDIAPITDGVVKEEKTQSSQKPSHSGTKCTSTPNTAVMKRQLAPSPFASPVLKQPCTARDDTEADQASPTFLRKPLSSPPLSPHNKGEGSLSDDESDSNDLAQPLCLADLCTQTSEFTSITSTTCTGYFNGMALEDSERDTMGINSIDHRNHPLHSTAAHPGSVLLSNWQQTPVHSATTDSQNRNQNQSNNVEVHPPASGYVFSGGDSGVGASNELLNGTSFTAHAQSSCQVVAKSQDVDDSDPTCRASLNPNTSRATAVSNNVPPSRKTVDHVVPCKSAAMSNLWKSDHLKHSILSTIHEGVASSPTNNVSPYHKVEKGVAEQSVGDSGLVSYSNDQSKILIDAHHEHTPIDEQQPLQISVATTLGGSSVTTYSTPSRVHPSTTSSLAAVTMATNEQLMSGAPPFCDRHKFPDHGGYICASSLPSTILPSHLKVIRPLNQLRPHPSIHSYATPFLNVSPPVSSEPPFPGETCRAHCKSSAERTRVVAGFVNNTTPHRSSSGFKGVAPKSKEAAHLLAPIFSDELLRKKELIKSQLHFKSPMKFGPSLSSKTPCSPMGYFGQPRLPLQSSSHNYLHTSLTPPPMHLATTSASSSQWRSPKMFHTYGIHHKENLGNVPSTPTSHRTRLKAFYHY